MVKYNGINSSNSEDVTNLFSEMSVNSNDNVNYIPSSYPNLPHDLLNNCFFDLSDVKNGLATLKNNPSFTFFPIHKQ